ncbi:MULTISPECIES: MFS transporter [unclassified Methylobacterium]|jgi:MFS family permease|uniref:MFS transporter n=1 Tax=unclassified Methylobacterium TaxID=2615210 RepID=UPI0006F6B6E9|nr:MULTISPECIES: MFS transporter [unclassified Methylobacterium]KQO70917.1 arabinose ABC transporter permease [Methylobacterium sp. Leaf88]KQP72700.1 arabinose ABC transporter permease [Methylobacterium sp. Leaf111]KQT80007.1 arabinose ABC transporter permease [Methylobacterium sp. Leaf465]
MSADSALPSSSSLERDAHEASSDHKVAPGEIAIGVVIGRAAEYFDFFVYGIASVLIFPGVFFPFADPLTGTLYAFALFALAFIARPIGSVIFMEIDRRHGRAAKLTIALFLLGGSTMAIGFLPNYHQLGALSIWILAALRFGQGLALGGAWDGLASLLALNAPEKQRGWYAMIPQLGAPVGFMLASALFAFFLGNVSNADFLDWGWRYPFFVAFAINVVALFARLRLVATEEFSRMLQMQELEPTPVLELLRTHGRFVLIGAVVPLASFALFHLVTVFPISWIHLFTGRSAGEFLLVQCSGAFLAAGTIVLSGVLADRIGRRTLVGVAAGLIGLFALASIAAPIIFGDSELGQTIYVLIGFGLLGLSYGQTSGSVTANLGTRFRYTGAALTSDLAWLIGAGFAPLVALSVSSRFGLSWVGVYLLSGAVATLCALAFNRRETARL